jgi:apolipoprotein N-acyltransferase
MAALCAVMCLWVLAFTPDPVAAAVVPGVVAGLALVEGAGSFRRAALWLALFGAVAIGVGYRWLVPTVRLFGGLGTPAAIGVLILFSVAGTVHAILFAGLYRLLFARGVRPHPLATATLLVACELLPIRFFPWTAGHGSVDVAPLRQLAEWGGLPLVSFATLCFAVPVHELLRWALAERGPPARPRAAAATVLVGIALFGAGWLRYRSVAAAEAGASERVRVAVVQADVGSTDKRAQEQGEAEAARVARERYERLTRDAAEAGAELIVWPETAIVGRPKSVTLWDPVARRAPEPAAVSADLARLGYGWLEEVGRDRTLLLGGYEDERRKAGLAGNRPFVRYNAAMLREPGGASWSIYRKVKLIPFGETNPLGDVLPALDAHMPRAFPMEAGDRSQPPLPWKAKGKTIVPFVCYEAILPDFVWERARGAEAPDLLVNLTNDSWFGDTWEPHQHLNFTRFRAVEHGLPLVRSTNTGVSAFVSAAGDVVKSLGVGEAGALLHDVPLRDRGRTVYGRVGGWVRWVFWAGAVVALFAALLRGAPSETPRPAGPGRRPSRE